MGHLAFKGNTEFQNEVLLFGINIYFGEKNVIKTSVLLQQWFNRFIDYLESTTPALYTCIKQRLCQRWNLNLQENRDPQEKCRYLTVIISISSLMVGSHEAPLKRRSPQQAVSLISKVLWMNVGGAFPSLWGQIWQCLCGFRVRSERSSVHQKSTRNVLLWSDNLWNE